MTSCFNTPIIFVALFFVVLAFIFMQMSNRADEEFVIDKQFNRYASPYYTTTFQAYPGKYMHYGSNRNSYCLQQHGEYAGYRNCMLYLE